MQSVLRVLLAGGGTAGHINPALTVADELKARGAEILFVGTPTGLEADLVPRAGYPLHPVRVRPLPRRLSLALVRAVGEAVVGLGQAWRVVGKFRPHVVVGTGGYVAGPVLLAAAWRGIPTVIHEQNAFPGATNRALARWVDRVALGYSEAAPYFRQKDKLVFVGNPVRREVVTARKADGLKKLGLVPDRLTVIIFGGSRGARSINEAVFAARKQLHALRGVQFIHQTGTAGFPDVVAAYKRVGLEPVDASTLHDENIRVVPYLYDMPVALAAADLVVARAGAISVAEITARGLPSVLIPYPHATGDHQSFNARPLVQAGAAVSISDHDLNGPALADTLSGLIQDREKLRKMGEAAKRFGRPHAAEEFAKLILATARRKA